MKSVTTSWRTTALGVTGAVLIAAGMLYTALGGDPGSLQQAPAPEWLDKLGMILVALGFVPARDHVVSSKKAGVES